MGKHVSTLDGHRCIRRAGSAATATILALGVALTAGCRRPDDAGPPAGSSVPRPTSPPAPTGPTGPSAGAPSSPSTGASTGTTDPPVRATTPGPPSPTTDPEEAAIYEAVEGYWRTWQEANDPPNPDYPELRRYYEGPALDQALVIIRQHLRLGWVVREAPNHERMRSVQIRSLLGDTAIVDDCHVDDRLTIHAASGAVVDGVVVTLETELTIRLTAGQWRVSENKKLRERKGAETCGA